METAFKLFISATAYLPLIIIAAITPYLVRRTEVFGVTIPEHNACDKRIQSFKRCYLACILGFGGISTAVFALLFAMADDSAAPVLVAAGTLFVLGIISGCYLYFHKKTKDLKHRESWKETRPEGIAVDTSFRTSRITVSPLWFLLYAVIILATFTTSYALYDYFPQIIPVSYGFKGEVIQSVQKSYPMLLFAPGVQLFITAIMVFVFIVIRKAKARIDAGQPEVSAMRNRIFRYRWSAYTVFMGAAILVMFAYMNFSVFLGADIVLKMIVPLGFTVLVVIGAIVLSITTGQGGNRLKIGNSDKPRIIDRDDDTYWKLGIFYFNKNDPALFVEKRFGIGYTNNFARPASWLLMAGMLLIILAAIIIPVILMQ